MYRSMRAARMASARVLICCSPNMSFRRSAFPGNFRKFLEISGGRRSAVGGRLRSAVGLPPPEVKFPWKFLDSYFLSRGQISKRISRNLCQGQGPGMITGTRTSQRFLVSGRTLLNSTRTPPGRARVNLKTSQTRSQFVKGGHSPCASTSLQHSQPAHAHTT